MNATTRAEFTHHHLNSAELFIEAATDIENNYINDNIDDKLRGDYISYNSSAIIASVAAFEANINEKFTDFSRHYSPDRIDLKDTHIAKYALDLTVSSGDIFSKIKNQPVPALTKYKMLALLRNGEDFVNDPSDVVFILRMRNRLIHFTPRWLDTKRPKKNLEKTYNGSFKNKFSLSPYYCGDIMFFPYKCLSTECSKWCFQVIDDFIKKYNSLVLT